MRLKALISEVTVEQQILVLVHIAILASSYSDDVVAIEVKNRKILIRFLEFPTVKFLKIWRRRYSLLAFLAFNLSEKFVRQGFRLAKKHQKW